ncbi:MAG: hypothetical protein IJ685_11415 [Selenomonadaceae bacterium]|nr:hypothetical protein [Selenomonadaceae bacterium]
MADVDKYADELLTDEQLENVMGGTLVELIQDQSFLATHGLANYRNPMAAWMFWPLTRKEVTEGWAKADVGFTLGWNMDQPNGYTNNGNSISRQDAMDIVNNKFPKK